MTQKIIQVDAFTDKPFSGNPACVCVLKKTASKRWMQQIAAEMNLSETAFLFPVKDDGFNLRWFTPTIEVDLCGHGTLAAAHVLFEESCLSSDDGNKDGNKDTVIFYTKSGQLTATKSQGWITMDFPSAPETETPPPPGLLEALGSASFLYAGKNHLDYIIELKNEEEVRALRPDFTKLRKVSLQTSTRGVIVTAKSKQKKFDFVSRFFAPAAGINEDPVTGSAHCTLAPFWKQRLGKCEMTAYQASGRGGIVRVTVSGNNRVLLSGRAVTTMKGELTREAMG